MSSKIKVEGVSYNRIILGSRVGINSEIDISNLIDCDVLILPTVRRVNISSLEKCRVVVLCAIESISVHKANDCILSLASSVLNFDSVSNTIVGLRTSQLPDINNCQNVILDNFFVTHSNLENAWREGNLLEQIILPEEIVNYHQLKNSISLLDPVWNIIDEIPSPSVCLAINALLELFDQDMNGEWDYLELNSFQESSGDVDRLENAETLRLMMESCGVPINEKTGCLRYIGLLTLYSQQGLEAFEIDVAAAKLSSILHSGGPPIWDLSHISLDMSMYDDVMIENVEREPEEGGILSPEEEDKQSESNPLLVPEPSETLSSFNDSHAEAKSSNDLQESRLRGEDDDIRESDNLNNSKILSSPNSTVNDENYFSEHESESHKVDDDTESENSVDYEEPHVVQRLKPSSTFFKKVNEDDTKLKSGWAASFSKPEESEDAIVASEYALLKEISEKQALETSHQLNHKSIRIVDRIPSLLLQVLTRLLSVNITIKEELMKWSLPDSEQDVIVAGDLALALYYLIKFEDLEGEIEPLSIHQLQSRGDVGEGCPSIARPSKRGLEISKSLQELLNENETSDPLDSSLFQGLLVACALLAAGFGSFNAENKLCVHIGFLLSQTHTLVKSESFSANIANSHGTDTLNEHHTADDAASGSTLSIGALDASTSEEQKVYAKDAPLADAFAKSRRSTNKLLQRHALVYLPPEKRFSKPVDEVKSCQAVGKIDGASSESLRMRAGNALALHVATNIPTTTSAKEPSHSEIPISLTLETLEPPIIMTQMVASTSAISAVHRRPEHRPLTQSSLSTRGGRIYARKGPSLAPSDSKSGERNTDRIEHIDRLIAAADTARASARAALLPDDAAAAAKTLKAAEAALAESLQWYLIQVVSVVPTVISAAKSYLKGLPSLSPISTAQSAYSSKAYESSNVSKLSKGNESTASNSVSGDVYFGVPEVVNLFAFILRGGLEENELEHLASAPKESSVPERMRTLLEHHNIFFSQFPFPDYAVKALMLAKGGALLVSPDTVRTGSMAGPSGNTIDSPDNVVLSKRKLEEFLAFLRSSSLGKGPGGIKEREIRIPLQKASDINSNDTMNREKGYANKTFESPFSTAFILNNLDTSKHDENLQQIQDARAHLIPTVSAAPSLRRQQQLKAILADASKISRSTVLSPTEIRRLLDDFEIVPEIWQALEATAEAAKWLESLAGRRMLSQESARILRESGNSAAILLQTGARGRVPAGYSHHAVTAAAREAVFVQRLRVELARFSENSDRSAQLLEAFIKDSERGTWPVSAANMRSLQERVDALQLQQISAREDSNSILNSGNGGGDVPLTQACISHPRGFEAWLRWRELQRRAAASSFARWVAQHPPTSRTNSQESTRRNGKSASYSPPITSVRPAMYSAAHSNRVGDHSVKHNSRARSDSYSRQIALRNARIETTRAVRRQYQNNSAAFDHSTQNIGDQQNSEDPRVHARARLLHALSQDTEEGDLIRSKLAELENLIKAQVEQDLKDSQENYLVTQTRTDEGLDGEIGDDQNLKDGAMLMRDSDIHALALDLLVDEECAVELEELDGGEPREKEGHNRLQKNPTNEADWRRKRYEEEQQWLLQEQQAQAERRARQRVRDRREAFLLSEIDLGDAQAPFGSWKQQIDFQQMNRRNGSSVESKASLGQWNIKRAQHPKDWVDISLDNEDDNQDGKQGSASDSKKHSLSADKPVGIDSAQVRSVSHDNLKESQDKPHDKQGKTVRISESPKKHSIDAYMGLHSLSPPKPSPRASMASKTDSSSKDIDESTRSSVAALTSPRKPNKFRTTSEYVPAATVLSQQELAQKHAESNRNMQKRLEETKRDLNNFVKHVENSADDPTLGLNVPPFTRRVWERHIATDTIPTHLLPQNEHTSVEYEEVQSKPVHSNITINFESEVPPGTPNRGNYKYNVDSPTGHHEYKRNKEYSYVSPVNSPTAKVPSSSTLNPNHLYSPTSDHSSSSSIDEELLRKDYERQQKESEEYVRSLQEMQHEVEELKNTFFKEPQESQDSTAPEKPTIPSHPWNQPFSTHSIPQPPLTAYPPVPVVVPPPIPYVQPVPLTYSYPVAVPTVKPGASSPTRQTYQRQEYDTDSDISSGNEPIADISTVGAPVLEALKASFEESRNQTNSKDKKKNHHTSKKSPSASDARKSRSLSPPSTTKRAAGGEINENRQLHQYPGQYEGRFNFLNIPPHNTMQELREQFSRPRRHSSAEPVASYGDIAGLEAGNSQATISEIPHPFGYPYPLPPFDPFRHAGYPYPYQYPFAPMYPYGYPFPAAVLPPPFPYPLPNLTAHPGFPPQNLAQRPPDAAETRSRTSSASISLDGDAQQQWTGLEGHLSPSKLMEGANQWGMQSETSFASGAIRSPPPQTRSEHADRSSGPSVPDLSYDNYNVAVSAEGVMNQEPQTMHDPSLQQLEQELYQLEQEEQRLQDALRKAQLERDTALASLSAAHTALEELPHELDTFVAPGSAPHVRISGFSTAQTALPPSEPNMTSGNPPNIAPSMKADVDGHSTRLENELSPLLDDQEFLDSRKAAKKPWRPAGPNIGPPKPLPAVEPAHFELLRARARAAVEASSAQREFIENEARRAEEAAENAERAIAEAECALQVARARRQTQFAALQAAEMQDRDRRVKAAQAEAAAAKSELELVRKKAEETADRARAAAHKELAPLEPTSNADQVNPTARLEKGDDFDGLDESDDLDTSHVGLYVRTRLKAQLESSKSRANEETDDEDDAEFDDVLFRGARAVDPSLSGSVQRGLASLSSTIQSPPSSRARARQMVANVSFEDERRDRATEAAKDQLVDTLGVPSGSESDSESEEDVQGSKSLRFDVLRTSMSLKSEDSLSVGHRPERETLGGLTPRSKRREELQRTPVRFGAINWEISDSEDSELGSPAFGGRSFATERLEALRREADAADQRMREVMQRIGKQKRNRSMNDDSD